MVDTQRTPRLPSVTGKDVYYTIDIFVHLPWASIATTFTDFGSTYIGSTV